MRKIPAPTTKRPIIIITTELEKPANASVGVNTPVNANMSKAHTATRSERTFPRMKKKEATNKVANVILIGDSKDESSICVIVYNSFPVCKQCKDKKY